ncbi:hypothetical protein ILUMI_06204 [Ignelater luminosus]|uniref:Cytochrome P450 n=1 Tax=Ignelater luminosus TaxID=2038154 RepID=A0A8K0GFM1_IGNLU|nr:hypothetical protein ILUMI_06204 [Ignelater luminosus]
MWNIGSKEKWSLVFTTFIISLTIIILIWLKDPIRSWYRAARLTLQLKGPPGLPLLGNISIVKDPSEIFRLGQIAYKEYGSVAKGWLSIIPIIGVLEPKYLNIILSSSKLSDKNFLYSFMHTFLGDGLITGNGNKSKLHRRYISLYFKINYLEQFISTFNESANRMVEQLKGKDEVKITTFINRCVLNILHQAIMGIPMQEQEIINNSPFSKGQMSLIQRVLQPWLLLSFFYKFTNRSRLELDQKSTIMGFSREVLEKRRSDKEAHKDLDWCLLDGLIEISETKHDFNDKDIVDEVCTFMLAGQDSVGSAIAFTLYQLAKHEHIQNKVIEEITKTISSSSITLDQLNEMNYLEKCIYESMRICPSVPLIARKLCEDVNLGEYVLPKGCNLFISPLATHRSPQHFPEPEIFDPERFSSKIDSCAYIPFSAGPRDCLGKRFAMLEMKTIISRFLQNYKISLIPGKEKLEPHYRVTLRAKGGIPLKLEIR